MDNFFVISLIKTGIVAFVFLTLLAYLQWIERKVLAHIQLRPGPYRVGPHGLLQPLADVIKLLTKEGFIPSNVNTFFISGAVSGGDHRAHLHQRHSLRS